MTTQVLGKKPKNLDAEDLKKLVNNNVKESGNLEYKSIEFLGNSKLAKEVSAFLNTDGGVIIFGIEEDDDGSPRDLDLLEKNLDTERISQLISDNIDPYENNIRIFEIETYDDKSAAVIEVPQSENPPHMSTHSKNTYYIRLKNRSVPAPHGQVEALFNRRRKPKILPFFEVSNSLLQSKKEYKISIGVYNDGEIGAEKSHLLLKMNEDAADISNFTGLSDKVLNGTYFLGNKGYEELPPSMSVDLGEFSLQMIDDSINLKIAAGTVKNGHQGKEIEITSSALNKMSEEDRRFFFNREGVIEKEDIEKACKKDEHLIGIE